MPQVLDHWKVANKKLIAREDTYTVFQLTQSEHQVKIVYLKYAI